MDNKIQMLGSDIAQEYYRLKSSICYNRAIRYCNKKKFRKAKKWAKKGNDYLLKEYELTAKNIG